MNAVAINLTLLENKIKPRVKLSQNIIENLIKEKQNFILMRMNVFIFNYMQCYYLTLPTVGEWLNALPMIRKKIQSGSG